MDEKNNERPTSWRELWMKTVELGAGAVALTKESSQKLINELTERGQMSKQEATETIERIREAGAEQRRQIEEMINNAVERSLDKAEIVRRADLKVLEERIAALEQAAGTAQPSPHIERESPGVEPQSDVGSAPTEAPFEPTEDAPRRIPIE